MKEILKQKKGEDYFINSIQPKSGCTTSVILFENRTARNLLLNKHYVSPWQVALYKKYGYGIVTIVPKNQESIAKNKRLLIRLTRILKSQSVDLCHIIGFQETCNIALDFSTKCNHFNLVLFSPNKLNPNKVTISKNGNSVVYLDSLSTKGKFQGTQIKKVECNGLGHQIFQYFELANGLDAILHHKYPRVDNLIKQRINTAIYQHHYNKLTKSTAKTLPSPDFKPTWRNTQVTNHTKNLDNYLLNREAEKVFCIGFHKTGTTSVNKALKELGFTIKSHYGTQNKRIQHDWLFNAIPLLNGHSAFEDMPWPINFELWDQLYPNAKFILTQRDTQSWYKSVCKYFGDKSTETRKWIYGKNKFNPFENKKHYISTYETHNRAVVDYFKDRPNKLLVFNLVHGDGWEPLCNFLDKPLPKDIDFPHSNPTVKKTKIKAT